MVDLWLNSGTLGIVLIPVVLLFSLAAGIVWLTHLSPARPFFVTCIGVTGPFFGSVAILFGLFAAFLASDVRTRNADIAAAVFREADGIRTMLRLAETLGAEGRPVVAAAVDYAQSVLTKEWPVMRGESGTMEDLGALRRLTLAALTLGSTAVAAPVHEAVVRALVDVRHARLERLTLSSGGSNPMSWLAMLILGLLTQCAVAVVHLDRLRPQALALFVFTTAFAVTVALVGLTEPGSSGSEIDAAPFRAALATAAL